MLACLSPIGQRRYVWEHEISTTEPSSEPTLPGVVVRREILEQMNIQQIALASALNMSPPRLNQFLKGHSSFTPEFALRLAKVTGTDAEYWLRLQASYDLHRARKKISGALDALAPLSKPIG